MTGSDGDQTFQCPCEHLMILTNVDAFNENAKEAAFQCPCEHLMILTYAWYEVVVPCIDDEFQCPCEHLMILTRFINGDIVPLLSVSMPLRAFDDFDSGRTQT